MQLTGHGTGSTPDEARANAQSDLDMQIGAMQLGKLAGLGFAGIIQVFLTALNQFFIRPIPALIVGGLSWVVWQILLVIIDASLPENPLGAVAIILFLLAMGVFALVPFAMLFKAACIALEIHERPIVQTLPAPLRYAIVGGTAFLPLGLIVLALVEYLQTPAVERSTFDLIAALAIFATFQVIVYVARQNTGRAYQDYDWIGRPWPTPQPQP